MRKWLTYFEERFPLGQYGVLIAAFAGSGLCLSGALRGVVGLPSLPQFLVAYICTLLLFLQLRIADEFKDYEEDCRYQPYRPVPRGLVKLSELGLLFIAAAVVQALLSYCLQPLLLIPLLVIWGYLGLMSKEFFVRDWLRAHPFTYMWTHMLILVGVDFYITACDWMVAGSRPPLTLALFLAISFFNGLAIEIGRKMRAPNDEEVGVETYTRVWGIERAASGWLAAVFTSALFTVALLVHLNFLAPALLFIGGLVAAAIMLTMRFMSKPVTKFAKRFETLSGVWVIATYLAVGLAPAVFAAF